MPIAIRIALIRAQIAEVLEDSAAIGTVTGLWICLTCGLIYDPAEGDPDGGMAPGTAFADIPDRWGCPVCGARKSDFIPYEG